MMPPDFFFNQCFEKTRLKAFLLWSYSYYGGAATADIAGRMKEDGFRFATQAGISIGLDDIQRPPQKPRLVAQAEYQLRLTERRCQEGGVTAVEWSQQVIDTWHRTSERLREDVVDHFRATDVLNPVYMMAFSGARGNISQVRQLTAMRGLMADPEGRIVGFPIRSSFREGLTLTEYMISCYGARKGLVDTALRTADAGYLTRRLVDVAHHVVVKGETCGTRQGILLKELTSTKKKGVPLHDRLLGRVLAADVPLYPESTELNGDLLLGRRNQIISDTLADQLASQRHQVLVRSPLKCRLPGGVCQLCYGWNLSKRKLVTVGHAVGIIAAQSIGEPGTQLTMRTFHTGGVFSGELVDEMRAPHSGVVRFPSPLQGLLIRTSHGRVAFLIKVEGECIIEGTESPRLHDGVFSLPKTSSLRLEATTILYVRQGQHVFEGEVIAQSPTMESEMDDTVQDTRIVFARSAGQVALTRWKKEKAKRKRGARLRAIWILAGNRFPLADPAGVRDRLKEGHPSLPRLTPPRITFNDASSDADGSQTEAMRTPAQLLPMGGRRIDQLIQSNFLRQKDGEREGDRIRVTMATIHHLHGWGGHLVDHRSLLTQLFYGEKLRPFLLQRGYPQLSGITWETPELGCRGGEERRRSTRRAFQGEMERPRGKKAEATSGAILLAGDQISFSTGEERPFVSVGQFLHAGQRLASSVATPMPGQVIRIERGAVTMRRTETILAYARSQFFVAEGEWIDGSTPLVELPYRQLMIDDIVQGIPKIEQLFEAAHEKDGQPIKNGVQERLKLLFQTYGAYLPLGEAVKRSMDAIQEMLVEGILKVYLSQGVVIADKHLEIIIRQMTSKVAITTPGRSGLFRGEYVAVDVVAKINRSLPRAAEKAVYRPVLCGITRTALDSESFLSAASFQETTRVLTRYMACGKIDYLRGLKEHVIVGDFIPTGTGLKTNQEFHPAPFPLPFEGMLPSLRFASSLPKG